MTRKRIVALAVLMALLSIARPVNAVGTVTVTHTGPFGNGVHRYEIAWTSNGSGAVSANTTTLSVIEQGHLKQVEFIPGSGSVQPTDQYDITLVDSNSVDLLGGTGANLSNATGAYIAWNPPMFFDGRSALDVVVANAGNAKSGTVVLWVGP